MPTAGSIAISLVICIGPLLWSATSVSICLHQDEYTLLFFCFLLADTLAQGTFRAVSHSCFELRCLSFLKAGSIESRNNQHIWIKDDQPSNL